MTTHDDDVAPGQASRANELTDSRFGDLGPQRQNSSKSLVLAARRKVKRRSDVHVSLCGGIGTHHLGNIGIGGERQVRAMLLD